MLWRVSDSSLALLLFVPVCTLKSGTLAITWPCEPLCNNCLNIFTSTPRCRHIFFAAPAASKVTFCHRDHHWGVGLHNFCDPLAVVGKFFTAASFSEWCTHCANLHRLQCNRCGEITRRQPFSHASNLLPVSHASNLFHTTCFLADELIKSVFWLMSS